MQYKETGMSGFSVKRVNVVGAFASLWAFIFAFFPFYRIEPVSYTHLTLPTKLEV